MSALFDRIGGPGLELVLRDFYDRVFADLMIGYLFQKQDKARLIRLEWQLTARILGAPVKYQGRGMRAAHQAHPIMKGHFMRRNQILADTLRDHRVDPEVQAAWMAHARAAETSIIGPRAAQEQHCNHELSTEGT